MKNSRPLKIAGLTALFASAAFAQTAPAPASTPTAPVPAETATTPTASSDDQLIKLPAFTVDSTRYDTSPVGEEASSTTRIATDLFSLPQSVKVFNREMLDIINPENLSDMVNYVGGAQSGTLSWTSGRLIIRGFVSDGDYVDGFFPTTASNVDLFLYDRIEVIKGASAIFNAGTPPGGLVSKITKSPTDYAFGNFTVQVGDFDADKAELDLGGPITNDGKLTYRFIATDQHSDGYYDNTYLHRALAAPMLKYAFSHDTQLTIKFFDWKTYWPSYNGFPLDPNTLGLYPGVPYTRNLSENAPYNWRKDVVQRTNALFTSRLNSWAALRLAGEYGLETSSRVESIATSWTDGTVAGAPAAQPGSGEFAAAAAGPNGVPYFFEAPFVPGSSLLPRAITAQQVYNPDKDAQGDIDFNFKAGPVSQNILAGGEFVDDSYRTWTYQGPGTYTSPVNPYAITRPVVNVNYGVPSALSDNLNQTGKIYIHDTAGFFDDRLSLSYTWIRVMNTQDQINDLTHATTTGQYYVYQDLRQYGALFKVLPTVSVFYSQNQAFSPNAPNNNLPTPSQLDVTDELGAKFKSENNRLQGNVSYFEASASNNTVPSYPLNPLAPTVLIAGIVSHGFDGDFSYAISKNWFLMGTFADYKAFAPAQPANVAVIQPGLVGAAYGVNGAGIAATPQTTLPTKVPVDDVAEHTYSLLGKYAFTDATFKGLSIAVGVDYQGKRAITNNANQVFFGYIPGRTLVNLFADYKYGHFSYSLNVDNLADTKYIYSARSVNVIVPGTSIDPKVSVTYHF
jgi:iron complex outermembrane receptor protein